MVYEIADLKIWLYTNCVYIKDVKLSLPLKEYETLKSLAINSPSYLSLNDLKIMVNTKRIGTMRAFIYKLRNKINKHTKNVLIENLSGSSNYRLVEKGYYKLPIKKHKELKDEIAINIRMLSKKYKVPEDCIKMAYCK